MITTRWIKHLKTKQEQNEFIKELKANEEIFTILENILKEEITKCNKDKRSLKSYLIQPWSEYQADRNATERTLREILDLIPIKRK